MLRTNLSDGVCGFPDVSFHGVQPWRSHFSAYDRYVGVLFTGWERDTGPQVVYLASNAYWESLEVRLPDLPASMRWELVVDTWDEDETQPRPCQGNAFAIRPRSVMVFVGR